MTPPASETFVGATAVKTIDSHHYEVNLQQDWCIGAVPNGGYVTSCFIQVASTHFGSTLAKQDQPHTMAVHMEFPRRTAIGPAFFTIKHVKLGRQTSTIHMTLMQNNQEVVLCYLTQSNLFRSVGPSFPSAWTLYPFTPSADLSQLRNDHDKHWAESKLSPFAKFRKCPSRFRYYFPRGGQVSNHVQDQWIRFRSGENFTMESLGVVCDCFPQIVDRLSTGIDPYDPNPPAKYTAPTLWYPTVVLNIDIKKAIPKEGVEWLFSRAMTKQVMNGKLDIEVVVMDATGDIVALSHHVALVVDASRNLAGRTGPKDFTGGSKI